MHDVKTIVRLMPEVISYLKEAGFKSKMMGVFRDSSTSGHVCEFYLSYDFGVFMRRNGEMVSTYMIAEEIYQENMFRYNLKEQDVKLALEKIQALVPVDVKPLACLLHIDLDKEEFIIDGGVYNFTQKLLELNNES